MLHHFLSNYREALIDRCRVRVDSRTGGHPRHFFSTTCVPLFLDQLILTLKLEHSSTLDRGNAFSTPSGESFKNSDIGKTATKHGRELSDIGYTLEQVVHDYDDLCQAILDVAVELALPIKVKEFCTLKSCLNYSIAGAVTEFHCQRQPVKDVPHQRVMDRANAMLAS